mgnify:CR=1 FL=1
MSELHALCNGRHFSSRLSLADAGFQAAQHRTHMHSAVCHLLRRRSERQPDLGLVVGKLKARRQHSDDGHANAVERQGLTYEVRSAAEPSLPETLADDGNPSAAGLILGLREQAALIGRDAQQSEQLGVDQGSLHTRGFVAAGQYQAGLAPCSELLEGLLLRAPVQKVRIGDTEPLAALRETPFRPATSTVRPQHTAADAAARC